ncbi:hypothetical protein BGZ58_001733, partial [Dissophora ornata]
QHGQARVALDIDHEKSLFIDCALVGWRVQGSFDFLKKASPSFVSLHRLTELMQVCWASETGVSMSCQPGPLKTSRVLLKGRVAGEFSRWK